jgi:hypothetical protein
MHLWHNPINVYVILVLRFRPIRLITHHPRSFNPMSVSCEVIFSVSFPFVYVIVSGPTTTPKEGIISSIFIILLIVDVALMIFLAVPSRILHIVQYVVQRPCYRFLVLVETSVLQLRSGDRRNSVPEEVEESRSL